MAPITKTLALAGALFAISGAAAPVNKRAVVWETVTDVVWTTVDVTTTIYPDQGKPTATVIPVASTTAAPVVPTTTAAAVEEKAPAAPSSSSSEAPAAPAPTSSSSEAAAPAPQPTEQPTVQAQQAAPAETSTSTAAPTQTANQRSTETSSSSSSGSGSGSSSGYTGACSESSPCTGEMTFYDTATSASAPSSCGTTNDGESEFVLALPVGIMKDNDCGKSVTIEYNGVKQTGTVVDKCMGCDDSSIDLSKHLFEAFASFSEGRLTDAKWYIH
ncbi:hypothetical protein PENSTE_c012G03423 [Penicillium steckii]|uniref:RlpA-like protein double-psi beta-barrel domain-containing protein n=1 Tax=Penicillium steckii TaxID=303698 RepID=A0A1V6T5G0_9EURO|nr:hypothetical protein PENSTE_c012G03423 [Penicillium steckii]